MGLKGLNPEERFLFDGNEVFGQISETGQIFPDTVVLLKIFHICSDVLKLFCGN